MRKLSIPLLLGDTATATPESAVASLREVAQAMGWSEEHVLRVAVGMTMVAAAAWQQGQRIGVVFPEDDEAHVIVTQYTEVD